MLNRRDLLKIGGGLILGGGLVAKAEAIPVLRPIYHSHKKFYELLPGGYRYGDVVSIESTDSSRHSYMNIYKNNSLFKVFDLDYEFPGETLPYRHMFDIPKEHRNRRHHINQWLLAQTNANWNLTDPKIIMLGFADATPNAYGAPSYMVYLRSNVILRTRWKNPMSSYIESHCSSKSVRFNSATIEALLIKNRYGGVERTNWFDLVTLPWKYNEPKLAIEPYDWI